MQLVSYILQTTQDLLHQLTVQAQLLLLEGSQLDPHYHLLQDVVVAVVLQRCPLPLLELLLQLEVKAECFGIDLMQIRQEIFT